MLSIALSAADSKWMCSKVVFIVDIKSWLHLVLSAVGSKSQLNVFNNAVSSIIIAKGMLSIVRICSVIGSR